MSRPALKFKNPDADTQTFFAALRKNVDSYFRDNQISKNNNNAMVFKTVLLFSAYVLPFIGILVFQPPLLIALPFWILMGFALSGIGMSVMHDANHGAYSKKKKVNDLIARSIHLLGGTIHTWKLQHNILHHTYTNIPEMDDDIETKMFMRFSPGVNLKWYHRFQFIYAFLFYGLLTMYWVTAKDFVQLRQYTKENVNKNTKAENRRILLKMILGKIGYYFVFIGLPLFILKMPVLPYLIGFLTMLFVSGVLLSVIFQLAHTVEDTTHPLPNEDLTIENCWAIHQLNTTVNFAPKNKFLSWYIGGLNFQVEHHLFPTICHVHYPKISPIVQRTAEEFGIPYLQHQTFGEAFQSHIRTLKKFGREA